MMLIQMLHEYKGRTEYKLLNGFYDCQTVSLSGIQNGVLVLPGILLIKMGKDQLNLLNSWIELSCNQLILTPTWIELNLKNFFAFSIDVLIDKADNNFNGIPVNYKINSTAKDILFQQDGNVLGINYRKNTGTGLITVITLPLLDYKLIRYENKLKSIFDSLIKVDGIAQEPIIKKRDFEINELHIYLIILTGANVDLTDGLSEKIKEFFGMQVDKKTVNEMYNELVIHQYICADGLMDKGLEMTKKRKLKSFINAIKQRGEKEDGWS